MFDIVVMKASDMKARVIGFMDKLLRYISVF